MGFILFILSFILVVIFAPIGIAFTALKGLIRLNYKVWDIQQKNMAISLDQFGNVAMKGLFNVILINSNKHEFGDPDETISSVLGKNKKNNSLAYLGRRLDALLNGIDKNHSIKSIEE